MDVTRDRGIIRNNILKTVVLFVALGVSILFPKMAFILADYFGEVFEYKQFSVKWDFVHHIIQMILALGVMILPFWRKSLVDWGFNNREKKKNKAIIIKFTLGFLVFYTFGEIIYLWLSGWPSVMNFNINEFNVWGKIIFAFTMPGLSEEVLFRALIMGILFLGWQKSITIGKLIIPYAGIIAAILFAISHVGFTLIPFEIYYYNITQLVVAFILGVFYSYIYVDTKSLLAPIIIHNLWDGVVILINYILTVFIIH